MAYYGNFVDTDDLSREAYEAVVEEATAQTGVLITEGPDAAKIIVDAFPSDGYLMGDALELRDLVLQFNKDHHLTPTIL